MLHRRRRRHGVVVVRTARVIVVVVVSVRGRDGRRTAGLMPEVGRRVHLEDWPLDEHGLLDVGRHGAVLSAWGGSEV